MWVSPQTGPEMRIWGQVVYLGADPGSRGGAGVVKRGERRAHEGCVQERISAAETRVHPVRGGGKQDWAVSPLIHSSWAELHLEDEE